MIQVNDTVRITTFPKGHINEYARVTRVTEGCVFVSNLNMPFQGTLCNTPIYHTDIAELKK